MTSQIGNRRGLTLIEVLVSVVMLATGTVFIMHAFASAAEAHARLERQTAAWLFAVSKIDEVALALQEGQELGDDEGTFRSGDQLFVWTVHSEPDAEDPQMLAAGITVTWQRGTDRYERQLRTTVRVPLDVPA